MLEETIEQIEDVVEPVEPDEEPTEVEQTEEQESVVVTIGEEEPESEEDNTPVIRGLRKEYREAKKREKELARELEDLRRKVNPEPELKEKPTLAGCEYDEERLESELIEWHESKRAVDEKKRKEREAEEDQQKKWQQQVERYNESKTALKVPDFDDAESVISEHLNTMQQAMLVKAALNPATLAYAIGKNPKKAQELGALSDPIEFTAAIVRLEAQVKVSAKKPPEPEKLAKPGTARVSSGGDDRLEKLRAEAAKTGDYSKVLEYRSKSK